MEHLTSTERLIIDTLAKHSSMGIILSLSTLADECHVAKSTIIKAIKKLGFNGYNEFSNAYVAYSNADRISLFPSTVTVGRLEKHVNDLASILQRAVGKKNAIYPSRTIGSLCAANYISRKLSMFDLFAPVTYDRLVITPHSQESGIFIFFPRISNNSSATISEAIKTSNKLIRRASIIGYSVCVISDMKGLSRLSGADCVIPISENSSGEIDLFASKVMILFEQAFAVFSNTATKGSKNGY